MRVRTVATTAAGQIVCVYVRRSGPHRGTPLYKGHAVIAAGCIMYMYTYRVSAASWPRAAGSSTNESKLYIDNYRHFNKYTRIYSHIYIIISTV